MPRFKPMVQDFSRGLQTRANEDGQPLPEFREFRNARVRRSVTRRPGMVLLETGDTQARAYDLDSGTNDYFTVPPDSRIASGMGTSWTLTILCNPSSGSDMTLESVEILTCSTSGAAGAVGAPPLSYSSAPISSVPSLGRAFCCWCFRYS